MKKMKIKKIAHSLIIPFFIVGFATNTSAQVLKTKKFYIQHETSQKYLHPSGGNAGKGVDLVLFDGVSEQASFYIEYADDGLWGYLVSSVNPSLSVHPRGSSINSGDGSLLGFWTGKKAGSQFRINPMTKTIEHKSGRFWHPSGGSDLPGNGTKLVIFSSYNNNTRFITVDRNGAPMSLKSPIKTSTRWKMVSSEKNGTNSTFKFKVKKTVGSINRSTVTKEEENTFNAGMESSLFGIGATASVEHRTLITSTKECMKKSSREDTVEYDIPPYSSIALWQRELVGTHLRGGENTMGLNEFQWLPKGEQPK